MSGPKAVLDANVLYGEFVRDMLLSLFYEGLFEAKWTEEITAEWVRHLLGNKPTLTREAVQNTVMKMHLIRPSPLVDNYQQFIDKADLPDRDDRHVLAAAIASDARKIVTWNLRDFPEKILAAFGIVAESPDKFLSDLVNEQPAEVARVFRNMRARRKKTANSVDEFFETMKRGGLGLTVRYLERYRDLL
jgi:predicted nucleic acid-binding protein